MTTVPPVLAAASGAYFVPVRSTAFEGGADNGADSAGIDGAVEGPPDGGFEAVVPHADPMIALVAIRANKRFRIWCLLQDVPAQHS
jgi:hypothetical protein